MAERICSKPGCGKKYLARGLCSSHYDKARRSGELQPLPPDPNRHSLTNVDRENKTADCAVCGPGAPIRVRERKGRGGVECISTQRIRGRDLISDRKYYSMVKAQEGRCAICGSQPEEALHVDHCHDTLAVRGLLCRRCNFAIGFLGDSVQIALSVAAYLEHHMAPGDSEVAA